MRGVRVAASTTGSLVRLTMPLQNVCASHVQRTTVIAAYSLNDNSSTWARAPRYNVHLLATASRLLRGVALFYLRLHHLQRRVAP